MGIAYRFFRQIDWWPTFYALGDSKVVFSHRAELAKVVEDPRVTTERFFLSLPVSPHPRCELIDHSSTGDFCFKRSIELGYEEIYLIGIEGAYVEEVDGSRPLSEDEFLRLGFDQLNLNDTLKKTLRIMAETPEDNPNYFFSGYQQAGDVYSLPQSDRHRERWTDVARLATTSGVEVVNLSEDSQIVDFPKSTLSTVLQDTPAGRSHSATGSFWYGPFDRQLNKRIEEAGIVLELFESAAVKRAEKLPIMVDVGACKGGAFRGFAKQHWTIHAFEPNPPLYADLLQNFDLPNVIISDAAVSDVAGEGVPFYTSHESIGIGSLRPFQPTHELTAVVDTITLDDYLGENGLDRIDFLKIDTEGFDLMVLKGVDLSQHPAEVILCEFEDRKTEPLGYSVHDMAKHLESSGYTVYVSEWHPILQYGGPHQWRMLKRYPCDLEDPNAWGNLLAFKSDPGIWALTTAFTTSMQRFEDKQAKKAQAKGGRRYEGLKTEPTPTALDAELQDARARIKALENELSKVYASNSWKITAPIRAVADAIKRVVRRMRS